MLVMWSYREFLLSLIINSLSIKRAYTVRSKSIFLNTSNILIQRMTFLEILVLLPDYYGYTAFLQDS